MSGWRKAKLYLGGDMDVERVRIGCARLIEQSPRCALLAQLKIKYFLVVL